MSLGVFPSDSNRFRKRGSVCVSPKAGKEKKERKKERLIGLDDEVDAGEWGEFVCVKRRNERRRKCPSDLRKRHPSIGWRHFGGIES